MLARTAKFTNPQSIAVDANGDLFIDNLGSSTVQEVPETSGTSYGVAMTAHKVYTIAGTGTVGFSGDGGLGTSAKLHSPSGVALGPDGNLYIADAANNRIREA